MSDDSHLVRSSLDERRAGFVEAWQLPDSTTGATGLSGSVALTRTPDYFGLWRSDRLFLDEEHELGAVPYGRRGVFFLPPGHHSLSVEMDWCSSPPYEIDVRPGELVELEASIRWRSLLWCLGLFTMVIMPGRFFVLRPTAGREGRPKRHDWWECLGMVAGTVLFLGLAFSVLILLARLVG
jgi:hypothetical protein